MPRRTKPEDQCVIDGCNRQRKIRGLCGACYTRAYVTVTGGNATWSDLEKRGLCSPRAKRGPPVSAPFLKAFEARK